MLLRSAKVKKSHLAFCLVLVFFAFSLLVEGKEVKLKDGIVLRGDVLSLQDGLYKIGTQTLGVLTVREADVVSITEASQEPGVPAEGGPVVFPAMGAAQGSDKKTAIPMDAYKRRIMTDPNMMRSIKSLGEDETFMKIFENKELMSAIVRKDADYLEQDESFQDLINHPVVRDITRRLLSGDEKGSSQQP